jgi:hypothetical protein
MRTNQKCLWELMNYRELHAREPCRFRVSEKMSIFEAISSTMRGGFRVESISQNFVRFFTTDEMGRA